jgi:hypothetical protein
MTYIELLNARFAERFGRPDGVHPRFAWKWAPDLVWYFRPNYLAGYMRRCWADRLGKVWLLCHWEPTTLTPQEWKFSFKGQYPYPAKGEYKPYPETALLPGMEPTGDSTAFYIHSIWGQLQRAEMANRGGFDEHAEWSEKRAQSYRDEADRKIDESIGDFEPLSWKAGQPETPGTRGGCVSFGGI